MVYTLLLAFVWYRETSLKQLPSIILESAITTAVVLLMIGCSIAMSRFYHDGEQARAEWAAAPEYG